MIWWVAGAILGPYREPGLKFAEDLARHPTCGLGLGRALAIARFTSAASRPRVRPRHLAEDLV